MPTELKPWSSILLFLNISASSSYNKASMSRHPSSLCLFVTVFRYPDTFNLAHVNPVDQSRHLIPAEAFRDQTPKGSNLEYILAHNNITVIQTGQRYRNNTQAYILVYTHGTNRNSQSPSAFPILGTLTGQRDSLVPEIDHVKMLCVPAMRSQLPVCWEGLLWQILQVTLCCDSMTTERLQQYRSLMEPIQDPAADSAFHTYKHS